MQNGFRSLTYAIALSRGKSVEKKEMRMSHLGQLSISMGQCLGFEKGVLGILTHLRPE